MLRSFGKKLVSCQKRGGGGCPLFSLDATGDRALFKPVQLNWGGRVSALWLIFCPFLCSSLFNLLFFFPNIFFLRGRAPLSRGARGHLAPMPPCKFGPAPTPMKQAGSFWILRREPRPRDFTLRTHKELSWISSAAMERKPANEIAIWRPIFRKYN